MRNFEFFFFFDKLHAFIKIFFFVSYTSLCETTSLNVFKLRYTVVKSFELSSHEFVLREYEFFNIWKKKNESVDDKERGNTRGEHVVVNWRVKKQLTLSCGTPADADSSPTVRGSAPLKFTEKRTKFLTLVVLYRNIDSVLEYMSWCAVYWTLELRGFRIALSGKSIDGSENKLKKKRRGVGTRTRIMYSCGGPHVKVRWRFYIFFSFLKKIHRWIILI